MYNSMLNELLSAAKLYSPPGMDNSSFSSEMNLQKGLSREVS
jgi:hypothetical protein